ncbi:MAG: sialidase family protein, partial [Planctomycetota bacterium]
MLLAVDFVPAPLGGIQPNRTDVALGIGAGSTQPTIALNHRDPGVLGIANEAELLRSTNAGATFDAAGNFQALLGTGATSQGSSDLVFTRDGELKWAGLQTDASGTQSVGVTFVAPEAAIFGVARVPAVAGAEAARAVVVADTNPASDSPYSGYIYVSFTDESTNRVLLSRSEDNGLTWTTPTQVSDDSETTTGNLPPVTPADVTIGPNGDIYVAYHYQSGSTAPSGPDNQSNSDGVSGQVFVRRSIDAGDTFISKTNAFLPGQADISLNVQTIDGAIERARFSTQGARQPTILADPVREGHIYVIANDDPDNLHGSGDEGDIVFARSTDFGETWDHRTIDVRGSLQVMP